MPISDCYSIVINSSDNSGEIGNNYNHETTFNEFLTNWTTSFLRYEDCLYPNNDSVLFGNVSTADKNRTQRELPEHLRFNSDSLSVVIVYSVLFVIAAVGNVSVFTSLIRRRPRNSRMSLLIINLTIADLVVTFFMIPLEIGWRITTQWLAGDIACKVFLFLRAFGLYLSSNVLVCVSMDRYFAVLYPLKVTDSRRRGKLMLCGAWFFSGVCAMPQSVIFHVSQHPEYPEFWQCVSFNYFSSQAKETAYNLFCVCAMYFVPLLIICLAYSCILCEISKKTRENKDVIKKGEDERFKGKLRLRRSDITYIERARSRTMCLSVTIVVAFVWCWTPYVVMTLWYMFDRSSAETVNSRLQDGLFIMAVSNSCVNPLVYGSYAVDFRCFRFLKKKDSRMSTVRSNGTTRTTVFRTASYKQRCHIPLTVLMMTINIVETSTQNMNHRPINNGNTNRINYFDLPNSSCELHSDSDHLPESLRLAS